MQEETVMINLVQCELFKCYSKVLVLIYLFQILCDLHFVFTMNTIGYFVLML